MKYSFLFGFHRVFKSAEPGTEGTSGTTPPDTTDTAADTTPETPEAPSSTPEVTPPAAESPTPSLPAGMSIDDLVKLVEALKSVPSAASEPTQEEPVSEPEQPTPQTPTQEQPSAEQVALRKLIIKQAGIPKVLEKLLPQDLTAMAQVMESAEFKQLLAAANTIQQASDESPKPKEPPKEKPQAPSAPKTFKDVTVDHLKAFDNVRF